MGTEQPGLLSATDRTDRFAAAWRDHRAYLVDLAFRMLGDIGEAEDVVQESFTRLFGSDLDDIQSERGWLVVVTTRLCLDRLRSARARRERPAEERDLDLRDPVRTELADPADRVTLDESVGLALLVVLQRLSPAERVVFVLHDVFGLPFDAIAQTVGRPAATCRQLARRARQKVEDARSTGAHPVDPATHRLVTERFIAACANGDLPGLVAVLEPAAWGTVDLGPSGERRPVTRGALQVARNLLRFWRSATLVSHDVGGQPAVLAFNGRRLAAVIVLGVRAGLVQSVSVVADPRKLELLAAWL